MMSNIPQGAHKLKLGKSFDNKASEFYHTVRYDFKPASLEECKECYVEFGPKCETTISIPKVDPFEEVKDLTQFKGSHKPYQKECLLIYDHETGEFILEDLTYCIQVKQVRSGEEEKEKNLQYIREIRRKCKVPDIHHHHHHHQPQQQSRVPASLSRQANDLIMSDEEENESDDNSSSSPASPKQTVAAALEKDQRDKQTLSDDDDDDESTSGASSGSEEDEIAKSLEAVVATDSAFKKVSPNLPPTTVTTSQSANFRSNSHLDDTLHDDLHLSDDSSDDD